MTPESCKEVVRRWAHCTCAPFLRFWPGDAAAESCRAPEDPCKCVYTPCSGCASPQCPGCGGKFFKRWIKK